MHSARVLIVDDDPDFGEVLEPVLSQGGYSCELAANAAAALGTVSQHAFDVVLADVRMDGMDGFELLDRLKREYPALPVILMTGSGGIPDAVDAMRRGAYHYVSKPSSAADILAIVGSAIDNRRRREGDPPRTAVSAGRSNGLVKEIVGSGAAMQKLRVAIDRVAASSAPVLITGETGSGKELVAHAIHAKGPRRGQPFVAVNTSAIPDELLEAEIFGHARGAFTGAAQARKGLLTEASGGTLLLDEIGDMPLGLQAKMLRVLQFGEVRPVGRDRSHQVDVRVIAATHRDLQALVVKGAFREDLYFRLSVLPLVVPPLRDRREDIPELVAHLLSEARKHSPDSPVRSLHPDVLALLVAAPWPGNVRELASAVERLVVFTQEEVVRTEHLSFLAPAREPQPSLPSSAVRWGAQVDGAPWTLKRLTQAYTDEVLSQTGGNKQRAAEILDIDLSTLYRWQRSRNP